MRAKKEDVKESIMGVLRETDLFELKMCLENVNRLEDQIRQINAKIASLIDEKEVERIVRCQDSARGCEEVTERQTGRIILSLAPSTH